MSRKPKSVDNNHAEAEAADDEQGLSGFIAAAGVILAISYPILAISTGFRAVYQLLFKEGVTNYLAPALTAVAALLYLIATIGFAVRCFPCVNPFSRRTEIVTRLTVV